MKYEKPIRNPARLMLDKLALVKTAMVGSLVAVAITWAVALTGSVIAEAQTNPNVRPPAGAVINAPPGSSSAPGLDRSSNFDIEMWKRVRGGVEGTVTIPDRKAGILVQSDGEAWRNFRNGPMATYGAWGFAGILGLLLAFFAIRGRIRIEHGWSGRTIQRFSDIERLSHWLMAVSFIILAITGLNIIYGRYVLLPVIGKEAFASMSIAFKWLHNYVGFAFMVGLVLSLVLWIRHNFPTLTALKWLAVGGGLLTKLSHPPARKFNAGQKILFWLVMIGGFGISLSGLAMMFPFQTSMFTQVFGFLGIIALPLPPDPTPIQEMQFATVWHGILGIFLTLVIIGHIYIGSIGMEGAFDAMGSGEVDVNWAKEHHSIWAEEELARLAQEGRSPKSIAGVQPAE